jgi:Flp pilus assembly protein protease CpaA
MITPGWAGRMEFFLSYITFVGGFFIVILYRIVANEIIIAHENYWHRKLTNIEIRICRFVTLCLGLAMMASEAEYLLRAYSLID